MDGYKIRKAENGWVLEASHPETGKLMEEVYQFNHDDNEELRSLVELFQSIVSLECLWPNKHGKIRLKMEVTEQDEQ